MGRPWLLLQPCQVYEKSTWQTVHAILQEGTIMLFVQHLCVVIFTCMWDVIFTLKRSTCVLSPNINISKFKGQTSVILFARY